MTRAEFLGKIFDCDPRDILHPIQEPTPICRYGTCACTSCEGCKSDPSYWNAPLKGCEFEKVYSNIYNLRSLYLLGKNAGYEEGLKRYANEKEDNDGL